MDGVETSRSCFSDPDSYCPASCPDHMFRTLTEPGFKRDEISDVRPAPAQPDLHPKRRPMGLMDTDVGSLRSVRRARAHALCATKQVQAGGNTDSTQEWRECQLSHMFRHKINNLL